MNRKQIINRENIAFVCIAFILLGIIIYKLFYNLHAYGISDSDEATHVANIYEMFKSNHWLVNTYRYEVDYYNAKPPLFLWMGIISMKIMGPSLFAARFPSVIACILLCVFLACFLVKNYGKLEALLFLAVFPFLTQLFEFHGFKTANMDSVFCFIIVVAMLFLYHIDSNPWLLVGWSFMMGMAFLTKSVHVVSYFLIGVLFAPFYIKKLKLKHIIASLISGIAVPLFWILWRYRFDGFQFLHRCIIGETEAKVQGITLKFFSDIFHSQIWIVMLICVVLVLLRSIIEKKINIKAVCFWGIWLTVPIVFYSIAGTPSPWYIYPTCVAVPAVISICFVRIINGLGDILKKEDRSLKRCWIQKILILFCICGCGIYNLGITYQSAKLGNGGGGSNEFYSAMCSLVSSSDEAAKGCMGQRTYIETSHDNQYMHVTDWHEDYIAMAEVYMDAWVVDGGVNAFLTDPDPGAVLILDQEYWDKYADVLTGHVMPENGDFIVITKDFY